MSFIPLPFGVKVVLEQSQFNVPVINVYWVVANHEILITDLETIVGIFRDWWVASIKTGVSADLRLDTVRATAWDVENGLQYAETGINQSGVGSTQNAGNVALCVTLGTGRIGRSYRGRTYIAGIPAETYGDNHVGANVAAAFAGMFVSLQVDLNAEDYGLVVASFRHNNQPRTTGVATPITEFGCNTRIDSQRRRLGKT